MSKKTYHEILIGTAPHRPKSFFVNIDRTKDVKISVGADYICVSCWLTKKSNPAEMFSTKSRVLSKALKRAMTLHIILCGRSVKLSSIVCTADQESVTLSMRDNTPLIYSLASGPLKRKLSTAWKKARYYQGFLRCEDTDLTAAITALIISKAKDSETERFLYLWMSINALYSFYAKKFHGCRGYNDSCMLDHFEKLYGFGLSAVPNWKSSEKGNKRSVDSVILRRPTDVFLCEIRDNRSQSAKDLFAILRGRNLSFSAYGYFLLARSYHHRCDLFHANRAAKLLSFPEESEILVLRALSSLLEEFLDHNLHKWFDQNYLITEIKTRAEGTIKEALLPLSE